MTPEEILNKNDLTGKLSCRNSDLNERNRDDIIWAMEEYGKQQYNEAIKAANKNAEVYRKRFEECTNEEHLHGIDIWENECNVPSYIVLVANSSILKLLKP